MKKKFIVGSIVALFALVVFNIVLTIYGSNTNVTGNVVQEPIENPELINQRILLKELEETNNDLKNENRELKSKINELQNEIQNLNNEKEVKKETCNLECAEDEICQGINKADGSVKFTCNKDPNTVIGAGTN